MVFIMGILAALDRLEAHKATLEQGGSGGAGMAEAGGGGGGRRKSQAALRLPSRASLHGGGGDSEALPPAWPQPSPCGADGWCCPAASEGEGDEYPHLAPNFYFRFLNVLCCKYGATCGEGDAQIRQHVLSGARRPGKCFGPKPVFRADDPPAVWASRVRCCSSCCSSCCSPFADHPALAAGRRLQLLIHGHGRGVGGGERRGADL